MILPNQRRRWGTKDLAMKSNTLPNNHSFRMIRAATLVALLTLLSASAPAKQFICDSFFAFYPSANGTRLDTLPSHTTHCGVCHYDFGGGAPRNYYSTAIEGAGFDLKTTAGRSNAIWSVRFVDSDTDGYINQEEITNTVTYGNTPTFPGLKTSNTNLVSNVSNAEIAAYLTPLIGGDTTPPIAQVL